MSPRCLYLSIVLLDLGHILLLVAITQEDKRECLMSLGLGWNSKAAIPTPMLTPLTTVGKEEGGSPHETGRKGGC